MGGMSIWHWLIVLLIVVLVFGSKKLGNVGSDLGRAIRDFKKGLSDDDDDEEVEKDKPEARLKADEDQPAASDKAGQQARKRDDN